MTDDCHQCCGREVVTPFCPYCGKKILGHTLQTLLTFCRVHLTQATRCYNEAMGRADEGGRTRRVSTAQVSKWSAWVKALEAVLGEDK